MSVILYSTGCPKCNILKKKLHDKHIQYEEFTNEEQMLNMGLKRVPVLSVDGKLLEFSDAVIWVNNQSY